MSSATDDPMQLDRSQTLDSGPKDGGEKSLTGNGSPNVTDDDYALLVMDPMDELIENQRKKRRIVDKSSQKPSKKARSELTQSKAKKSTEPINNVTDTTTDSKTDPAVGDEKKAEIVEDKLKPPAFTKIRRNHYMRKRNKPTEDEIPICDCPRPPADGMGCGISCVNRTTHVECTKGYCPCGDNKCSNMRFQNREYPKLKVVPAGGKGFGVVTNENVNPGQFVIEYVGEVIPIEDCAERMEKARHFYFLTLDGNEGIDASHRGNIARFINHSCDPNCETQKWWVTGETSIGIFAKKAIPKGSELTFDYQFERIGVAKQKCLCGSANCRGYLGAAPVKTEIEEVRYVFSNHNRHVDKMLKMFDVLHIDDEIQLVKEGNPSYPIKNKVDGGTGARFLKRNVSKQKAAYLSEYHELLLEVYKHRVNSLEVTKEQRRQRVNGSRNFLMGLDIASLMRKGLVTFDSAAPVEPKRRQKKTDSGEKEGDDDT